MHLKLKEDPREWQKFTAVIGCLMAGLSLLAFRRGWIVREAWLACTGLGILGMLVSLFHPRPFRGFYRLGMTASFHVGQVMGGILLTLLFLGVLTPLALILRVAGKDLLMLKRHPRASTFWRSAKPSADFDRMF